MRVYLAGPFEPQIIKFFQDFEGELNEVGIETTSTWYRRTKESNLRPTHNVNSKEHNLVLSLNGQLDLYELSIADVILVATCPPGHYHTGGRHVETGYSLAATCGNSKPKKIFIVGENKENIFHSIPGVIHLPDWKSAFLILNHFNNLKNKGPRIIGFAGKKGAGKTTTSEMVRMAFGHEPRNFATELRKELVDFVNNRNDEILNIIDEFSKEEHREELVNIVKQSKSILTEQMMFTPGIKEEYRRLQQFWGTDYRRKLDPYYWINKLNWSGKFSVGDVRFGNIEEGSETKAITQNGGINIYIYDEEKELQQDDHPSEQMSYTDCDYVLLWKKKNVDWCFESLCRLFGNTLHYDIDSDIQDLWYNELCKLN